MPHVGIVKSVLRLFDELAKCATEGLLQGVQEAVEWSSLSLATWLKCP